MSLLEDTLTLFKKQQCVNCQEDVTRVGIQCVDCHNGNVRLCLECFSFGAEIGEHKAEHSYRFFATDVELQLPEETKPAVNDKQRLTEINAGQSSSGAQAVFAASKWSAKEYINLLNLVDSLGIGNWKRISDTLENRSPEEVKEKYENGFVHGSIGELTWSKNKYDGIIDSTPNDTFPIPNLSSNKLLAHGMDKKQMEKVAMRYDDQSEHDNEAENLVSEIEFHSDDDEEEIGLKLAVIDIYVRGVRERARKKQVVIDQHLAMEVSTVNTVRSRRVSASKSKDQERTSSALFQLDEHEKMLKEKLRPFAQFYNGEDFKNLIDNLMKEKEMSFRIPELCKYRSNGITRMEECAAFEETARANAEENRKRSLDTVAENQQKGRRRKQKLEVVEEITTESSNTASESENSRKQVKKVIRVRKKKVSLVTNLKRMGRPHKRKLVP